MLLANREAGEQFGFKCDLLRGIDNIHSILLVKQASQNNGPFFIALREEAIEAACTDHRLRIETEKRGLNPNVWFGNVERVTSERIGREPVIHVSNIYKYHIACGLMTEQSQQREEAKTEGGGTRK